MKFAKVDQTQARPLIALFGDKLQSWLDGQDDLTRAWVAEQRFTAALGSVLVLPQPGGRVLLGLGDARARARGRFGCVSRVHTLPEGAYVLTDAATCPLPDEVRAEVALGWLLAAYRYDRYRAKPALAARLVCPEGIDGRRLEAMAAGECLTRDLINTPAADMGPDELESAARRLAERHAMDVDVTLGDALLDENFPMIHAVGRASSRAPRLIDMRHGTKGPKLTLVGKGVCFDTGGLNIKPGNFMGLMKKDMGGAAHVLGLSSMIMELGISVQLRVLIPAVENSIAGNALRPQDVLTSRKGLTVEINNTDAEGRLVLADALALADEEHPDLLISMATLTGAARVAVGPDIAPFYTDDDTLAEMIALGAGRSLDPVWRMPFHAPYEKMIEPDVADLDNAPSGSFAGSITAALFLRRFVESARRFAHFDVYGWQPASAPARPKGGTGQGCRALLNAIESLL